MPAAAAPLVILLLALAYYALYLSAKVWADALTRVFASGHRGGIVRIITLPFRLINRVVVPGVNYILHRLSKAALHYSGPLARFFEGMALLVEHSAISVGLFAERVAIDIERLATVVLPREIGREVGPLRRRLWKVAGGLAALEAALERYRHGIDRLIRHKVIPEVRHLARAVEHAIPHELGRIRARERRLERYVYGKLSARLTRLAKLLGLAYLTGLVVRVLVRRFPWLFCRRVNLVGKRVCGVDSDLLNSLLLDTLVIGGTISIVEFARELQTLERPVAELIHGFIRDS